MSHMRDLENSETVTSSPKSIQLAYASLTSSQFFFHVHKPMILKYNFHRQSYSAKITKYIHVFQLKLFSLCMS